MAGHEEHQLSEEDAAALALTEAKTRVVLRLVSRTVLWVAFLVLVLNYLFAATFWVVYALTSVLLVIILAVFFAYLIAPLVEFTRRPFQLKGQERVMPRGLAIGVVYLVIFGSLGLGALALLPRLGSQIAALREQAPGYLTSARQRANKLNEIYAQMNLPPSVRDAANNAVASSIEDVGNYVKGEGFIGALSVLATLPWLILIPILAFFFLKDADAFRRSALMMLPQGRIRWRGDELFQDINSTLAAYIRAQLIACLIIGSVCTLGFAVIGVRYALVLGVAAGLLEFIPLLGPLVVAVMAATVAGFDSGAKLAAVVLFLGALRIVEDYVVYPRIIGSGIHLHPLAVILAILAGHEIAGITGIFLAIPVIAVLTVTYRHWLEHRGSAGIVAELLKPAETPVVETPPVAGQIQPPRQAPAADEPAPRPAQ